MELQAGLVIIAAGGLALVLIGVVAATWLIEQHNRSQRIMAAVGKASGGRARGNVEFGREQGRKDGMVQFMGRATRGLTILKERQLMEIRTLLVSAGFRTRDAVVVYTFFKLFSPIVALGLGMIVILGLDPISRGPLLDIAAILGIALLGSKVPDLVVKNARQRRLDEIRKGFPDALDMLVICAEAGLSADTAMKRVVAETKRSETVLGDELELLGMELNFMPERRVALENFAARVPLAAINAFVNSMVQAERYGTPLARAFKVLSQELRTERMLRAEEKAGRLPATMTVPMMLFILPALFIVLIGPAVLDVMDNFIGMN